jgi:hypothetical protein
MIPMHPLDRVRQMGFGVPDPGSRPPRHPPVRRHGCLCNSRINFHYRIEGCILFARIN